MNNIFKKIAVILTFSLVLVLVACQTSKPIAYITSITPDKTEVNFDVNIIDLDNQIQGSVGTLYLYKGEEEVKRITLDLNEVKGNVTSKKFTGLNEETTYKFVLEVTIDDEKVVLSDDKEFMTLKTNVYEISTVEDFLKINDVLSTTDEFRLMNDLDFEGVKITKQISTFRKVFDGNKHTIKNMHNTRSIFGTISGGGTVRNLNIENMVIAGDKNEDGTYEPLLFSSTVSEKNFGFIADKVTTGSSSALSTIENVNIVDSLMKVNINTNTQTENQRVQFGSVVGSFQGKANNVNVSNSIIDVNSVNAYNVYIGGLFGLVGTTSKTSTSTTNYVVIDQVYSDVTINFNQEADINASNKYSIKESTTSFSREVIIGSLVGYLRVNNGVKQTIINDGIAKGSINANINYVVKYNDALEPDEQEENELREVTFINHVFIGGLIGRSENAKFNNLLFDGQIDVTHNNTTILNYNEEVEDKHKVVELFYVGALIGENKTNELLKEIYTNGFDVVLSIPAESIDSYTISSSVAKSTRSGFEVYRLNELTNLKINDVIQTIDERFATISIEEIASEYLKDYLN